ncbi:MAG: hypothetical protein K5945_09440 [Bacteroidaceae bacterium]|nr:hypothetical protein [Bacteroidaceae bacterium]
MNRRNFLSQGAMSLAALGIGTSCTQEKKTIRIPQAAAQSVAPAFGEIRALLLHLGSNMWCDFPTERMGGLSEEGRMLLDVKPETHLVWTDEEWQRVTEHAAGKGINMIVLDLGEGLFYPSHPELAVPGSWSVERMQAEIQRLNAMGFEVIPKLNFSTTHNGWMGDYSHMVSSKPYYRMCEDVIRDVADIFGHPRFFHVGFDEERASFQEGEKFHYICVRKGEYWWRDFLHIVGQVEKAGARPWMWSDYAWTSDDFFDRCPKSVVQQNWFYDSAAGGFDLATNDTYERIRLETFYKLDQAGFDQVPCGTNWPGGKRRKEGLGADDVIGRLTQFSLKNITKAHFMGLMMGTWEIYCWDVSGRDEYLQKILHGIDLFGEAIAAKVE